MHLQRTLAAHDWKTFARYYNGPLYETNRYDERLKYWYDTYKGALPNIDVRMAQAELTYLGFMPGRSMG